MFTFKIEPSNLHDAMHFIGTDTFEVGAGLTPSLALNLSRVNVCSSFQIGLARQAL